MALSRKIEIKFHWCTEEGNDETMADYDIIDLLEHEAEAHICKMRLEGYTSGELNTEINGINYRGWWEFNYV